jgi:myosin heavy subunit
VVVARGETFDVPYNPLQATVARDAIARSIYARLFDWLVSCVNNALAAVHAESSTDDQALREINVLDIYGFEVFDVNGFEQVGVSLCFSFPFKKMVFWGSQ